MIKEIEVNDDDDDNHDDDDYYYKYITKTDSCICILYILIKYNYIL